MPDRIIRDELLQSTRWLDLPTDSHRLVFISLVLQADDYGNVEGGPRRLYRWMHSFTQVKSEADSIKLMSDLQDVDLIRRYEVEGREYWHIPRFRNLRRYWSRKWPKSPFAEQDIPINQESRQKTSGVLAESSRNLPRGVGVGVGEDQKRGRGAGEGENQSQKPVDNPEGQPPSQKRLAGYLYKRPDEP